MSMGRPKAEVALSEDERSQLTLIARSQTISGSLVPRARIVLAAAAGAPNSDIAQRLQLTRATVGKWRIRFVEHRINGLYDEVRPGKPRTIDDERLAQLILKPCIRSLPMAPRTEACVRSRWKRLSRRRACTVTSSCWVSNRIAAKASSSRPINSSSRNCAMCSACT